LDAVIGAAVSEGEDLILRRSVTGGIDE